MQFDIHTFILGAVQGLCEFLPVSSSGHLALLQHFFGFRDENLVAFDLLLHCATVLVIMLFFWRDIAQIIAEWCGGWITGRRLSGWSYGWAIIIATVLTGIIGLPLRKVVDEVSTSPLFVGAGLIFTSFIMSLVPIISRTQKNASLLMIAVVVGIAQGVAVLPGVSRSGMTIAAGLLMGLGVNEAFRFSFLISVPAVLGASLLEALKVVKSPDAVFLPSGYMWAVLAAFVLGFLALGLMRRLVLAGKWAYFGFYCMIVGILAVLSSLEIF